MEQSSYDSAVQVAVLYERIGHIMSKVDDLGKKIDVTELKRDSSTHGLERRVAHVEKQLNSFRWFVTGIAAGGGLLGGAVASVITQMFGGS